MTWGEDHRRLAREFPTHAEAKWIADVCARIEGTALAAAGLLSLVAAYPRFSSAGELSLLPFVVGGASVLAYLVLRRGTSGLGSTWHVVAGIAQLRLLAGLGALLAVGGAVGMLGPPSSAGMIRTLVVGMAGVAFAVNKNHGNGDAIRRARLMHRAISVALVLAAALGVLGSAVTAAIALLAAGILLLVYAEPLGAMPSSGLTTHYMDMGETPRR